MRLLTLFLGLFITAPLLAQEPKVHKDIPYAEPKNERQMLDVYATSTVDLGLADDRPTQEMWTFLKGVLKK